MMLGGGVLGAWAFVTYKNRANRLDTLAQQEAVRP